MINIPFECNPSFPDEVLKNAILYIPKGTLSAYEKVDPWRNFWNIQEREYSRIDNIKENNDVNVTVSNGIISVNGLSEQSIVEIFDISGKMVHRGNDDIIFGLDKGIYIVKIGNKSTKVVI